MSLTSFRFCTTFLMLGPGFFRQFVSTNAVEAFNTQELKNMGSKTVVVVSSALPSASSRFFV